MQRFSALLIYCMLFLMISACDDDDGGTNNNNNSSSDGTVTATVDGDSWSATVVEATWSNGVLGIGAAQIQGGENKQINISGLVAQAGTYNANPLGGLIVTFSIGSAADVEVFTAISGTIEITEITAAGAKGTFSFRATSQAGASVNVTNGTFNVTF